MTKAKSTKQAANRAAITKTFLKSLEADGRRALWWDTSRDANGYYVIVYPSGRVVHKCYQRVQGQPRHYTIPAAADPDSARAFIKSDILPVVQKGEDWLERQREAREANRHTIGGYLKTEYAPYVRAKKKTGGALVARITDQFSGLFPIKLRDDKAIKRRLRAWEAMRLAAGKSPATIARDLSALSGLFRHAVELEEAATNPVRAVARARHTATEDAESEGEARARFLDEEEEKRLRGALSAREADLVAKHERFNEWRRQRGYGELPQRQDHLRPIVLLAINTGMRRGEILGLTWERVDFDRKQLTIPAGGAKTNKTRRVPLNSEAIAVLRDWTMRTGHRTGPVFPSRKGASLGHFRKSWASLVGRAGIENFRFHDLRHHAASRMVMGGIDLYTVARVLGHSSTTMTQRYAHLAPGHLQDAVEVLAGGN